MAEEDKFQVMKKLSRIIEPKEYFFCCNGLVVKSLQELPGLLEKADNQQFLSHVTDYKNDFAKWIYDVFDLQDLSTLLGPIKSKEETVRIIRAYLAANSHSIEEPKFEEVEEETVPNIIEKATQEDKFADVAKLASSTFSMPKVSEEKVSRRILDLINRLEEKVEAKIAKKPLPLPPKELPRIKPPEIRIDVPEEIPKTRERRFVLPNVRKHETSQTEKKDVVSDRIKQIEERLKKENQDIPQIPAEEHKAEIKQETKKEEFKPVQKTIEQNPIQVEEPKPEIKPIPIKIEVKDNDSDKINEPDRYFEKNPIIISQFVEAKKQALQIEKLKMIKYSGNELPKELVELFKDNYGKAYQYMVSMRKAGFDAAIAEIMMARIPPKIKIYEASQEERDSIPVKRYLNEAIEELNNLK